MSIISRAERRGHEFSANARLANVSAWHETRGAARHAKGGKPNPNTVEDDAPMYHGTCRLMSSKITQGRQVRGLSQYRAGPMSVVAFENMRLLWRDKLN